MTKQTASRCPICQCALVAAATWYLCTEHGRVDAISLEPQAKPVSATESYHPHGADPEDIARQLQVRPVPAITASDALPPLRHDPWPRFDEPDDTWIGITQQINRYRSNFLLVTNSAHRQAMNEFEIGSGLTAASASKVA